MQRRVSEDQGPVGPWWPCQEPLTLSTEQRKLLGHVGEMGGCSNPLERASFVVRRKAWRRPWGCGSFSGIGVS